MRQIYTAPIITRKGVQATSNNPTVPLPQNIVTSNMSATKVAELKQFWRKGCDSDATTGIEKKDLGSSTFKSTPIKKLVNQGIPSSQQHSKSDQTNRIQANVKKLAEQFSQPKVQVQDAKLTKSICKSSQVCKVQEKQSCCSSTEKEVKHSIECVLCYEEREPSNFQLSKCKCFSVRCKDCHLAEICDRVKKNYTNCGDCHQDYTYSDIRKAFLTLPQNDAQDMLKKFTSNKSQLLKSEDAKGERILIECFKCKHECFVVFHSDYEFKCHKCNYDWCYKHNCRWHRGKTCKQVDDETQQNESMTFIEANFKACPVCNQRIEKTGGCNNMTCSNCTRNFCWNCCKFYGSREDVYNHMSGCY